MDLHGTDFQSLKNSLKPCHTARVLCVDKRVFDARYTMRHTDFDSAQPLPGLRCSAPPMTDRRAAVCRRCPG